MEERSSAAPAVRQLRQLQHDLSTGFENFSIRNAEAAIYNVFVCFDLVPQQLVTLYVFWMFYLPICAGAVLSPLLFFTQFNILIIEVSYNSLNQHWPARTAASGGFNIQIVFRKK